MVKDCPHILVIDDDTRLRALLQRYLQENGFAVSAAKDAENARMFLRQYQFNLLIVDVMMPGESGIEFLQKLRRDSNVPAIVHITPVEQAILCVLGAKSGQIFTREHLAELLGVNQSPRSIDVQITRLRKKIETDSKNPRYLQTVRGKGYMLLTK